MKTSGSVLKLLVLAMSSLLVDQLMASPIDDPPKGTDCQTNSESKCMRTCRENCDKLQNVYPEPCTRECNEGCECINGYIFKSSTSTECVPYAECPVKCPEHMHYDTCTSTAQATCENLSYKNQNGAYCEPWCVCDEGYVYRSNQDRTCVLISQCSR